MTQSRLDDWNTTEQCAIRNTTKREAGDRGAGVYSSLQAQAARCLAEAGVGLGRSNVMSESPSLGSTPHSDSKIIKILMGSEVSWKGWGTCRSGRASHRF